MKKQMVREAAGKDDDDSRSAHGCSDGRKGSTMRQTLYDSFFLCLVFLLSCIVFPVFIECCHGFF